MGGGAIDIELGGDAAPGQCADCGAATRNVWGYVDGDARAVYYIRWTEGHVERGAQLTVSIGAWGEGTTPDGRSCIAIECRMGVDRPGFMIVDAAPLSSPDSEFLGVHLSRDAALASPLKPELFAILDAVVERDARFRRFLSGAT
jgi:hypothetical protein